MKHIKTLENWFFSKKDKTPKKEILIKSKIDPNMSLGEDEYRYSEYYIEEKIPAHNYEVDRSDKIICPLCKTELGPISHGERIKCHNCKMRIRCSGNCLTCVTDQETIDLYTKINKFNL